MGLLLGSNPGCTAPLASAPGGLAERSVARTSWSSRFPDGVYDFAGFLESTTDLGPPVFPPLPVVVGRLVVQGDSSFIRPAFGPDCAGALRRPDGSLVHRCGPLTLRFVADRDRLGGGLVAADDALRLERSCPPGPLFGTTDPELAPWTRLAYQYAGCPGTPQMASRVGPLLLRRVTTPGVPQ